MRSRASSPVRWDEGKDMGEQRVHARTSKEPKLHFHVLGLVRRWNYSCERKISVVG